MWLLGGWTSGKVSRNRLTFNRVYISSDGLRISESERSKKSFIILVLCSPWRVTSGLRGPYPPTPHHGPRGDLPKWMVRRLPMTTPRVKLSLTPGQRRARGYKYRLRYDRTGNRTPPTSFRGAWSKLSLNFQLTTELRLLVRNSSRNNYHLLSLPTKSCNDSPPTIFSKIQQFMEVIKKRFLKANCQKMFKSSNSIEAIVKESFFDWRLRQRYIIRIYYLQINVRIQLFNSFMSF